MSGTLRGLYEVQVSRRHSPLQIHSNDEISLLGYIQDTRFFATPKLQTQCHWSNHGRGFTFPKSAAGSLPIRARFFSRQLEGRGGPQAKTIEQWVQSLHIKLIPLTNIRTESSDQEILRSICRPSPSNIFLTKELLFDISCERDIYIQPLVTIFLMARLELPSAKNIGFLRSILETVNFMLETDLEIDQDVRSSDAAVIEAQRQKYISHVVVLI